MEQNQEPEQTSTESHKGDTRCSTDVTSTKSQVIKKGKFYLCINQFKFSTCHLVLKNLAAFMTKPLITTLKGLSRGKREYKVGYTISNYP